MRAIQLRPNHRPQIPNRNLQRIRRRALRLPAHIHGWPGQRESDSGVDARGGEEDADVAYAGAFGGVFVGEEDGVADYGGEGGGDDEGGAAVVALGDDGVGDGEEGGEGVGGDGEELGGGGGVAEGFYY